jgi:nucleoside-diphosphate-sugar epimerase
VNPKSESSKLRYAAEEGWLDLVDELDLSAFVLRLGGIYGPGRRLSYANTSNSYYYFSFL